MFKGLEKPLTCHFLHKGKSRAYCIPYCLRNEFVAPSAAAVMIAEGIVPTVSATRDSLHGPRQCKLRSRAIAASFINKAAYNRNERLCDNTSNEMSTSSSNTTEKRAHMKRLDEEPTCELARELLKNDQLGRREIVAQFIHLLYSVNGPYSIFIDAPWGTGKTP